jgi:uncharacterized protein YpmB
MKRALLTISILFVILIAAGVWFYQIIQGDYYDENERAMETALSLTSLTRADHVDYYAGEQPMRIVFGANIDNEKMIVWVGNETVHEEKANNGADRNVIRAHVNERHGEVEWVRLLPGMYANEYVWEAFFKKQEEAGIRHYYEYYRFDDGQRLDTLRLSLE